jgi:hypothetical protein
MGKKAQWLERLDMSVKQTRPDREQARQNVDHRLKRVQPECHFRRAENHVILESDAH